MRRQGPIGLDHARHAIFDGGHHLNGPRLHGPFLRIGAAGAISAAEEPQQEKGHSDTLDCELGQIKLNHTF